jgi:hypothetical protein
MTALEACDKIEEAIEGLHEETRNSGWDWSYTVPQGDAAHLGDYTETLEKTRSHFELPELTVMWFVSVNGSDAILAKCGNSPTAEARSRYISWVNPQNVKLLIDRLRELESAVAEGGGKK